MSTNQKHFLQQQGPFAGLLLLCLALGVATAASFDAWSDGGDGESSAAGVYAAGAAALTLVIAAALTWLNRMTQAQAAAHDAGAREREDHAHLWALLSSMELGMLFMSERGHVVYCNPAFLRIWKVPPEPGVIGATLDELLTLTGCTLARPAEQSRFVMRAPPGDSAGVKLDLAMADGRFITQQSHPVNDALGRLWVFEDVTVERRNATQLVQLTERDALTGLYNRHRFNEESVRMSADAQRNGTRLALLFFNLDGFKHINDTFGHRAGDAMLIKVASEIGGQVRRNEIFARLRGDEFAILVPDAVDELLRVLAERVTRSISQMRIAFEGQTMRVSCSCGIAVCPDNATTPGTLMACADAAMNQVKEAGKNDWRFYRSPTAARQASMLSPLSPEGRIRHALENNLLVPHLQGIYATGSHALRHYEVLMRVRDPENPHAMLLPNAFIAMAEKSASIVDVDRWMLAQAIQKLGAAPGIPALAVNVSGRSLDDATLPAFIAGELQRHGVAAQRLWVELTETAAVSDLHDARRFIEALQATGCSVSLDDFGNGFASFAYLKHLNVDAIKIDGLFIRDLPQDRENQLFVQAIVTVARGLHKTTIAECVEDEATLKILATLGVDYVQGFHFEMPHVMSENGKITPA